MRLNKLRLAGLLLLLVLSNCTVVAEVSRGANTLPFFDARIYYIHDVWDAISPEDAIRRLREVGVKRAMVSSSSDEGTQRLYQADPTFVVPSCKALS